jgi:hypothetical protein
MVAGSDEGRAWALPPPISLSRRRPLASAGQRARPFSFNFLLVAQASRKCGDHEEGKSHNACAKNDNEECK